MCLKLLGLKIVLIFAVFGFHYSIYGQTKTTQDPITVPTIEIELGERILLSKICLKTKFKISSYIWVEKPVNLKTRPAEQDLYFVGVGVGESFVRIGSSLLKMKVVPIAHKMQLEHLKLTLKPWANLNIRECSGFLCLDGTIESESEFRRFFGLLGDEIPQIKLNIKLSEQLQKIAQKLIGQHLKDFGLEPISIQFSDPWKAYLPVNTYFKFYQEALSKVGIAAVGRPELLSLKSNVELSIKIVEINKSFARTIGISWPAQLKTDVDIKTGVGQFGKIEAALNAAETQGEARTLASPRITCKSGEEASFFAGGEIPIRVTTNRASRVEWRRFGVALKFKAHVDHLKHLSLNVETEISTINPALRVDDVPAIQVNKINSYFDFVKSSTIILSGLIKNENSTNSDGIPWLKSLPILGSLFSSKNYLQNNSELMIFVTPKFVETDVL